MVCREGLKQRFLGLKHKSGDLRRLPTRRQFLTELDKTIAWVKEQGDGLLKEDVLKALSNPLKKGSNPKTEKTWKCSHGHIHTGDPKRGCGI